MVRAPDGNDPDGSASEIDRAIAELDAWATARRGKSISKEQRINLERCWHRYTAWYRIQAPARGRTGVGPIAEETARELAGKLSLPVGRLHHAIRTLRLTKDPSDLATQLSVAVSEIDMFMYRLTADWATRPRNRPLDLFGGFAVAMAREIRAMLDIPHKPARQFAARWASQWVAALRRQAVGNAEYVRKWGEDHPKLVKSVPLCMPLGAEKARK